MIVYGDKTNSVEYVPCICRHKNMLCKYAERNGDCPYSACIVENLGTQSCDDTVIEQTVTNVFEYSISDEDNIVEFVTVIPKEHSMDAHKVLRCSVNNNGKIELTKRQLQQIVDEVFVYGHATGGVISTGKPFSVPIEIVEKRSK